MKNILTIFTLTFLSITTIYSQNNSTKKADKHFSRLEFVKAAQEYLELINKGNSGDYVISQLAESYYNIFNTGLETLIIKYKLLTYIQCIKSFKAISHKTACSKI